MAELKKNGGNTDKPAGVSTKIGKEMKIEAKPENVKAEEKKLSPQEEALRKDFTEVEEAMKKFNMYPVAANEQAKNEALATLRRIYAKKDPKAKQVILYMLHETLSKIGEYRAPKNFEYFKKKMPQAEPMQLRMNVYRGMFDYSTSLEGLFELAGLLGEFGDDDSAKLLTHHFSFLCSFDGSESSRMLRNAVAEALGESDSVYALKALLSYAHNVESEMLGGRIIASIVEWKDKVKGLKIEQKEKDELMKKISELVLQEHEEGHYR